MARELTQEEEQVKQDVLEVMKGLDEDKAMKWAILYAASKDEGDSHQTAMRLANQGVQLTIADLEAQ